MSREELLQSVEERTVRAERRVAPTPLYRVLRAALGLGALAHFLIFVVALPWWRITSATAEGRSIAFAYLGAFASVLWGAVGTMSLWLRLRWMLAMGFAGPAAADEGAFDASAALTTDVGGAVAGSRYAPRFLRELRARRLREDAAEREAEALLSGSADVVERVRRGFARMVSSFTVGLSVFAGLMIPLGALSSLPDGSLLGVPYGAIIAVGGSSALMMATVLGYGAYHALRALRHASSLSVIARFSKR